MRVRALATAAAVGLILPVSMATTASAVGATAGVTIIHGIATPALASVDVYVDDELLIDDFVFEGIDFYQLPAGTYELPGTLHPDEVAEACGLELPEGPYETLAGFVLAELGAIPEPGATVTLDGWRI